MSETIVVESPPDALREEVENAVAVASTYGAITCVEQRQAVGNDLRANKALQNRVEAERLKIATPLTLASRALNTLFKRFSEPLEAAERGMKRAALAWDQEEDRRKMREYREAARKADEEKARLAAAAAEQKAAGNAEVAHALTEAAALVTAAPVVVEQAKVEGEAHQTIWRAECYAPLLTMLALVSDPPRVQLSQDEEAALAEFLSKLFGPRARSLRDAMQIPGVRAVSERILKSRAA